MPNGYGLEFASSGAEAKTIGVALNELTSTEDRDPITGTPWYKMVPARVEVSK